MIVTHLILAVATLFIGALQLGPSLAADDGFLITMAGILTGIGAVGVFVA